MSESDEQGREYSRVEAYIPFECRMVSPEEKVHIYSEIAGNIASAELSSVPEKTEYDPVFGEWALILNSKLDTIIRLMTLQGEGFLGLPFKCINISGGGMKFLLQQEIPIGEILEIKTMLAKRQSIALRIYGEVVKCEQAESGYMISIRYVQMDDAVRDEIIHFVFEREREIIRERKR